jgi:hypothetical protein
MPRYAVHGARFALFRLIRFMTLTKDLFRATTREGADNTPVEKVLQQKFRALPIPYPWRTSIGRQPIENLRQPIRHYCRDGRASHITRTQLD